MYKAALYSGATLCGTYYVFKDLVSFSKVTGVSMYPSLNPDDCKKDWVLLDERVSRNYEGLKRGDVVVFRSTRDPNEYNVKRLIGLEGDRVETLGYKNKYVKIPPGHCWLEGDNNLKSDDSNKTGPTPIGLITAKATFIINRMVPIQPKFPHSRVVINPEVDTSVVHYLNKLPSLPDCHIKNNSGATKKHLYVNAAESKP